MTQVSLPLWLFLALAALAAWALLERLLIPSVRWFLRRRINRVLDEVGTRLNIHIRPFQLTKRQVLIDRLAYDPKVLEAMEAYAEQEGMPREVAQAKVVRYAHEIVPAFNAYIYFRVGYWLASRLARLLYRVRVGFRDEQRLGGIDPRATVVFVMNHRSNMDYILVAFLSAEQTALSYAVGEWARIWPLTQLIRAMGAFFVRRNSKNPLYRRVLERYVHMATQEGVCQAVFPEGGLTRDGRIRDPKLGMLDYMLRGHDPSAGRDIVFVPVGINYDRVLEDRSLVRRLDPHAERRSRWFVIRTTLGFIGRNLWLMARSRWHRFGYACVNFGRPVSMRGFCAEQGIDPSRLPTGERFACVERFARRLMADVGVAVPVLPTAVVAQVLLEAREDLALADITARAEELCDRYAAEGRMVVMGGARGHTLVSALNMLVLRHLVVEAGGRFQIASDSLDVLRYYANSLLPIAVSASSAAN